MKKQILIVSVLLAVSFAGWPDVALGAVTADYGDAPDPKFPSLYDSDGPYHLDVTKEWIGKGSVSTTTTESNSKQVDLDEDDNHIWLLPLHRGEMYFFGTYISYDPTLSSADEPRYLNVLLDWNKSGNWHHSVSGTGSEWVVRNYRVPLETLPAGITTLGVCARLEEDNLLLGVDFSETWARITLSTEPIELPTDDPTSVSWGEFARGETEDILLGPITEPNDADWETSGNPGGFLFGAKALHVIKNRKVKARSLLPLKTCSNCGVKSHRAPRCPAHSWVKEWSVFCPIGTILLEIKWQEEGGCPDRVNQWCPASGVWERPAHPVPGHVPLKRRDPAPAAVGKICGVVRGAGGAFTNVNLGGVPLVNWSLKYFGGWGALLWPKCHVKSRFYYNLIWDDPDDYWSLSDYQDVYINDYEIVNEDHLPGVDQVHLVGPIPNELPVGTEGKIVATVQEDFIGVPDFEVGFTKLEGDVTFTKGDILDDGTQATVITDPNGIAEMGFSGDAEGIGLIEASVTGTQLSAFSFFEIIPCPLVTDWDGDCDIDQVDFAILASAWQSVSGDDRWNPDCDIAVPADNSIDMLDLAVFVENWMDLPQ